MSLKFCLLPSGRGTGCAFKSWSHWIWKQQGPPKRRYPTHHYTVSQPRRPRAESSLLWKP